MGLYLHTDTGEQIPLATNTGWSHVGEWIEGLDADYGDLAHLWHHGWVEPVSAVREQLAAALKADAPDGDTGKTAQELLDSLTSLDDDAAVVVSNGMGSEDDDSDESPTFESLLKESGLTGTIKDKRGAERHYVDGKQVANQREEKDASGHDHKGKGKGGGQFTGDGDGGKTPKTKQNPHVKAQKIASALRDAVMDASGGDTKDWCITTAEAVKMAYPEAEVWSGGYEGMMDDQAHTIVKIDGYFIDVTADQFGGPEIHVSHELDENLYPDFRLQPSRVIDPSKATPPQKNIIVALNKAKSLSSESILRESGFSGIITTSNGAKRKYVDGKEVAMDAEPAAPAAKPVVESAPGPPPRPGLVWNDSTHRWRHPETGEEHEHTSEPAPSVDATHSPDAGVSPEATDSAKDAVSPSASKTPELSIKSRKEAFGLIKDFARDGWEKPSLNNVAIRMEGGSLTIKVYSRYAHDVPEDEHAGYRWADGYELFQSNDGGPRGKTLPKVYGSLEDAAQAAEARYKMLVDQGYAPKPQEGTPRHTMYQRAVAKVAADLPELERDKPHLPDGRLIPEGQMACTKCGGYGTIPTFGHVAEGVCFRCSGEGLLKAPKARKPKTPVA